MSRDAFREFSLKYIAQVISEIKTPGVPTIVFCKDCALSLSEIASTGCQVMWLDWAMDIAERTVLAVPAYLGNFPSFLKKIIDFY